MLKLIFWIVVGVLALSFFGISLQEIVNSPAGRENFAYLFQLMVMAWQWLIELIQNKVSS
ncbi:hypothetical protein A3H77_02600 [Candidatus Kaiserbacteria bacterium RIFCSPLOWO2_02_FULL_56_11]|uniref:Uncharacterized protein n=2 Tax=Candidatus Kaiseribacteriota TaxID=1752734 RepID=A0A1F6E4F1_9BACT|nr:MAG: hypothetical protein A3C95_01810 [Candidatus Kaiserbacteria bacterium RIFCSPHIGHO2_02_FULL_56_30]OGG72135.1 MAG: hypothetical protein A3E65_00900 [Candidatus Kaiserbacteria bacterium RIFCSPHIGHO2_12_FULL_56_13]OGG82094.1 MAG: hypothetical protein A3H77_02600 [Candidatus Kaiserbacteria bacterium RIFCSPLOWO2_02_FULL_56_11]